MLGGTTVLDCVQLQPGGRKTRTDNEPDVIAAFPEQSADCRGSITRTEALIQVLQINMTDTDT